MVSFSFFGPVPLKGKLGHMLMDGLVVRCMVLGLNDKIKMDFHTRSTSSDESETIDFRMILKPGKQQ